MSYQYLLINVDELWLKGKNRPIYFQALFDHVRHCLRAHGESNFHMKNMSQRIIVENTKGFKPESIVALQKVAGIYSVQPAIKQAREQNADAAGIQAWLDHLGQIIAEQVRPWLESRQKNQLCTFKVETTRSDKRFPMTSMEVSYQLGGRLLDRFPALKVDVKTPELMVELKILPEAAFITTQTLMGIGGLPIGMNGHLITMISGGFDSPVASFLMSKRGCEQSFIFFYAYPFVGEEVKQKIFSLMQVLGTYQKGSKLYVIPFGNMQNQIAKTCREEYRTFLFRYYMVQVANALAQKLSADALLTGDAIGQVSSQTVGSLSLIDQCSERSIFRPLVGYNKREIISTARMIGTHDISMLPHDDACSLFAPKHPIIKPDKVYLSSYNKQHDLGHLVVECLEQAEIYQVSLAGNIKQLLPEAITP